MDAKNLIWRERTSELPLIASVWTCNASKITSRTVLADPCMSLIFVKGTDRSEVIVRGPETKPRSKVVVPGYTWTVIRLQPGVQLKGVLTQKILDSFLVLPADQDGRFEFEGMQLQFPDFRNAELLIEQMQERCFVSGWAVNGQENPAQSLSSKSYSRLIKRNTGLSPYKLHQLQRIHVALTLLKQGMSATDVAAELGFVDQAHLTRAAKQFLGHTPKELVDLPQDPSKNIQ